MKIAIIGLGLIGGSVARALAGSATVPPALGEGRPRVAAWSRRPAGPRAAVADGVLDAAPATLAETLDGAGLVVLAAPPLVCLELLGDLAGPLGDLLDDTATITDVVSTKRTIVARADANGLCFVGGHPMAGRETTGYAASTGDLFVGRPWIVCAGRHARPADVSKVEALATSCGARPLAMEPGAHDRAVAAISHLPLVVSAALVEAVVSGPGWRDGEGLAAGGWRDMSRLARGDPAMAAGIAATNAAELLNALVAVRGALDSWIGAVERADAAELEERFRTTRMQLDGS